MLDLSLEVGHLNTWTLVVIVAAITLMALADIFEALDDKLPELVMAGK
jgi:hypothetical protein